MRSVERTGFPIFAPLCAPVAYADGAVIIGMHVLHAPSGKKQMGVDRGREIGRLGAPVLPASAVCTDQLR